MAELVKLPPRGNSITYPDGEIEDVAALLFGNPGEVVAFGDEAYSSEAKARNRSHRMIELVNERFDVPDGKIIRGRIIPQQDGEDTVYAPAVTLRDKPKTTKTTKKGKEN